MVLGNSFPIPLSAEEEEQRLLEFEQGSLDARNTLIERNLRLVAHIVKKYGTYGDADDLISIGTIGLMKAVSGFRRGMGARLATYAARCIENEILMYIRANKKRSGDIYLQDVAGVDKEGNEVKIEDRVSDESLPVDEQVGLKLETAALYEKISGILRGKELQVILLRYGLTKEHPEKTQREIGVLLGISRSYVSRIEKKALKKLWREMSDWN
ncbi:MAG: RNA polymerase sporulation sigma factor SigK [Clostridiales bacterium]|nr:RNA polymerase sporulation sigma factor SigK [Clostridiales bacterium]